MEDYPQAITKQEINTLPLGRYQGDIHIITSQEKEQQAYEVLENETLLGFDTETRPAFTKGVIYPTSLLQLAGENAVYLFRLTHIGFPEKLQQILANPSITKVGVAIRDDLRELKNISKFYPTNFRDLNKIADQLNIQNKGLRNMAALFLGIRISKTNRVSPWHRPVLSAGQISYAATDAWASREIYLKIKSRSLLN
ncbi:MAG TPA: 3'-5' exonuclease [Balneolales bacterium]|nr:3'-5' exonuclease [Balneolales bacterium]